MACPVQRFTVPLLTEPGLMLYVLPELP